MVVTEFSEAYEDEQRIRGAILTEPISALEPKPPVLVGPEVPVREAVQAVVGLPVGAHLPGDYVPHEAQKLELDRPPAGARTTGDVGAFPPEGTDRPGARAQPLPRAAPGAARSLCARARGARVSGR